MATGADPEEKAAVPKTEPAQDAAPALDLSEKEHSESRGTTIDPVAHEEDIDEDIEKATRPEDEEKVMEAGPSENLATEDKISKVQSKASAASRRSRISDALSRITSRKKKERLAPTLLPLMNLDEGIVGWEHQEDPECPLNFPRRRKWIVVASISLMTLMTPLSSSILAPAISSYDQDFGNTDITLGSMPVSIYLLGYAVGPLVLAPASEIWGRWIVLTAADAFFCVWHIGCALAPTLNALIVFRFLSGIGGSACLTLGGGLIADMFPVEERGLALSLWTIGPLIGPSIGPLIGSFITATIGWRWAPWIVLIPSVIVTAMLAFTLPETFHKVLIERKVKRLHKEHNRTDLRSCFERDGAKLSQIAIMKTGFIRPLKMLVLAPIILLNSAYVAFIYGTIYLMYNSVPTTFEEQYGWPTSLSGLAFISLGIGYAIGTFSFSVLSDKEVIRQTKANDGVFEPEMRLSMVLWYAIITPTTFFWYGWSAQYQVQWMVPIIGLAPLGIGIFGVWMAIQAYIIDAYPVYAASGLAAFAVLRSVVAAFLPLAGPTMFANLGLGWGNSVLGFICIGLIPVPVLIFKYGGWIRKRYPVKL